MALKEIVLVLLTIKVASATEVDVISVLPKAAAAPAAFNPIK